jgi:hypothetical protein
MVELTSLNHWIPTTNLALRPPNKLMKTLTFLLLFATSLSFSAQSSDSLPKANPCDWRLGLSGAFINGGELNSGSFEYVVGQGVYASLAHPVSEHFFVSASGGIEVLTNETFYPLFASFIVQPNPSKKFTLQFDLGHSFAEHSDYEQHLFYQFHGGRMTGVGISQFLQVGNKSMLQLGARFRHQLTRLTYTSDSAFKIEEKLNYLLLSFTVGLYF